MTIIDVVHGDITKRLLPVTVDRAGGHGTGAQAGGE